MISTSTILPRLLLKRSYLTYAWIASLIVVLIICWIAWHEKNDIVRTDAQHAALYARVLDDHVLRTLDIAALAISDLADIARAGRQPDTGNLQAPMMHALASLTFIRSLSLIDQQGLILVSSLQREQGLTIDMSRLGQLPGNESVVLGSLVQARYLEALRMDLPPAAHGFRVLGLPLIRRIVLPDASVQYLVALINPDFFASFQTVSIGDPNFTAVLMTYAGDVLVSDGQPMLAGGRLVNYQKMTDMLKPSDHGTYVGPGAGPGDQIVSVRTSHAWPIVTLVERPMAGAFEDWLKVLVWLVTIGVMMLAVIAVMARIAWRSAQSKEAAQRELFRQLAFTDRLLEISPLPIYMLDTYGVIVRVNQALEVFMGLGRESLLGRSTADFLSDSNLRSQTPRQERLLAQGAQARYEWRLTKPDGVQRDVLLSKVVVSNDDGSARGVLAFIMDITEYKDAERAIVLARDAAQAASLAKSEFIANISHELRTPLQSILGFSELGVLRVQGNIKIAGMFQDIHSSGQRMLALVNDLLDIAKIESSVTTSVFQDVDIRSLIQDVLTELGPLFELRQIRLVCLLPEGPFMAHVDILRIHQVLRNVVANALKFSAIGHVIEVQAGSICSDRLRISVRDEGCGIPPDELETIFEPFMQSSLTKDGSGGTGLGLAICRRIMVAHGGCIHAENLPQGGAVFHIDLPRLSSQAIAGPLEQLES
jgi:PAS domain S-box-containing protein